MKLNSTTIIALLGQTGVIDQDAANAVLEKIRAGETPTIEDAHAIAKNFTPKFIDGLLYKKFDSIALKPRINQMTKIPELLVHLEMDGTAHYYVISEHAATELEDHDFYRMIDQPSTAANANLN